jgi:hypothetical protein
MKKKLISYDIVRTQTLEECIENVRQMIFDGWEPKGGIEVEPVGGKQFYYQAMVFKTLIKK